MMVKQNKKYRLSLLFWLLMTFNRPASETDIILPPFICSSFSHSLFQICPQEVSRETLP